jgi:hypothetical protein
MIAVVMIASFKRIFQQTILVGLEYVINLTLTASDD